MRQRQSRRSGRFTSRAAPAARVADQHALPSNRIHLRWAKSARALLTVSARSPDELGDLLLGQVVGNAHGAAPCVPKRCASCSSCLATRPERPVKIRSARLLLVRRSRRASTRSSCSAISGRSEIHALSASRVHGDRTHLGDGGGARRPRARVEDRQLAKHVRRAHDRQQVLPAVGSGGRSSPAVENDVEPITGLASKQIPYARAESPPAEAVWSVRETAVGSTPWKIPALARISSTLLPLIHRSQNGAHHLRPSRLLGGLDDEPTLHMIGVSGWLKVRIGQGVRAEPGR